VSSQDLIRELTTLNRIADVLNESADVRTVLDAALARLIDLLGLTTGWIFLKQPSAQESWQGRGYVLAAHHGLPPALALDNTDAWDGGCDCQGLCNKGKLTQAYNEVRCSRLAASRGDRRGLTVHASVPLRFFDEVLGILNVAADDWSSFSPESLALLTNVGAMMGIALQRAQLFDMLKEQRIHEQAALLDLSSQLLSRLDLDDLSRYVVAQVQQLLDADACALLLPGDTPDQLVFRAAAGWNSDPVAAQHHVPADFRGGPGRVIQTQQPLLLEDLNANEWAAQLPEWLRAEGFHGHAVIPLIAASGSVGALMIDVRQPRLLDEDELRFVRLIGNQAALALEKARLHQEALRQQRLEQELTVARQIQLSLLPKNLPDVPGWEFATVYRAAHEVGGDFYATLEPRTGRLTYANAGHNRPLWLHAATGELKELASAGIVLGAFSDIQLEERNVEVAPGDVLVFYTDGVTEAANSEGQFFGIDCLREIVLAQRHAGAQQMAHAITSALQSFTGAAPQFDDYTLVIAKRL
jgi:GAF domain-containing protein